MKKLATAALTSTSLLLASPARADGWAARFPDVGRALSDGSPLVVHVLVPLCSERQIRCGGGGAGGARDLSRNLYWGAIFGARRFLDRPRSPFERVAVGGEDGDRLERVVVRRMVDGAPFGLPAKKVEQLVVVDAFDGDAIDGVVARFVTEATRPTTLRLADGAKALPVAAVVYAGHNRLLDGLRPAIEPSGGGGAPASIVLACDSEPTFGPLLRGAGGVPLLTTRAWMAPEGYLVESVLVSLGDGATEDGLRQRAVDVGVKWWRLDRPAVRWILGPFVAP